VPLRGAGIAGHECAGVVDAVGEGVTSVTPGDHVVMAPITGGCGRCMNCMIGLRHMCQGVTRSGPHHHNKRGEPLAPLAGPVGGLAEYTVVHEFQTAKVPDDLPMHVACLLGCGVLTGFGAVVNRAHVKPFQSVAVVGTGGVGLNAIQGAAFSGAHPVIAVDLLDKKLEAARLFGATHTVNASTQDAVQGVKDATGGRGVDYSFIMAASSKAVRQAFERAIQLRARSRDRTRTVWYSRQQHHAGCARTRQSGIDRGAAGGHCVAATARTGRRSR